MNAERLLAHYERIADASGAIPSLRTFILNLAVRGKLVPQDPTDEPACKLLERIAADKARLAKAGEIKRDKPSKPATAEDLPFDLVAGWHPAKIEQVLIELQTGPFGSSLHQSDYQVGGTPVINPASIQNERILPIEKMAVGPSTLKRLSTFKLRAGDIVMARRGEMGRCAVVSSREEGWLCGTGSLILRPSQYVYPRFLALLIGSPFAREYLGGTAVGTTMQNLNQAILLHLAFGLPPLAEQHRIVAKVDDMIALCDQLEVSRADREIARDRLTTTSFGRLNIPDAETFREDARFVLESLAALTTHPEQIKQLRQTILNLAVRGKLVPQDTTHEPASELLKRLKKAQFEAYSREELRPRPPVTKFSRQELKFDIPDSWEVASFDEVFVIISGVTKGQKVPACEAVDVPYLRVANVQRGHLDLAVIKTITVRSGDVRRCALRRGDVLMTEGGDWDKLGRAAIWREEITGCIHQNHVFRVRPPSDEILPDWVTTYVNSLLGRAFFENASKQTTNLASINMTQLRGCPLPLPPTAEQRLIVAKVGELMTLCDRLENILGTADDTRHRLLRALLAAALEQDVGRELEAAE